MTKAVNSKIHSRRDSRGPLNNLNVELKIHGMNKEITAGERGNEKTSKH